MNLKSILKNIKIKLSRGNLDRIISGISENSLEIKKNNLFFAVKGNILDGHQFIEDAISKGCTVVVCTDFPVELNDNITYIKVENIRKSISIISLNFYNNPSDKIKVITVTGTNGKTSVVYFLYQFFRNMNLKVGMLSTIENRINDTVLDTNLTTPSAITVNSLLNDMVLSGCEYCIMEVSSHAIDQDRIYGLIIDIAILTNISHDHLDYHKSFLNYLNVKKKLFDGLNKKTFAVINSDDNNSNYLVQNCNAKIFRYGLKSISDFKGKIIQNDILGLSLELDSKLIDFNIIGEFNAYNILAVYSVLKILNFESESMFKTLSKINPPDGRFEIIKGNKNVIGIVDYAHTPDALLNVLKTIKKIKQNRKVITVVGAGGERDKTKRPIMGKIASELSDFVIITSDNPRFENAMDIISDIEMGIINDRYKILINREDAIQYACEYCKYDEIILLAGKGHEKYQIINDIYHDFNDLKILKNKLIKI